MDSNSVVGSDRGCQPASAPWAHSEPPQRPAVVTLASLHGAGGHVIGPRVAERLGVAFLDRAIPAGVAKQAGVPEDVVTQIDEPPSRRGRARLIANLARVSLPVGGTGAVERVEIDERSIRAEIEEFLARASEHGGVVLGRGGAVVLRSTRGALHVHLGAPRAARVERVMAVDGVDSKTAKSRVDAQDRARMDYVRGAYGVSGEDSSLYHLMIDTLALGEDLAVDIIVAAGQTLAGQPTPTLQP